MATPEYYPPPDIQQRNGPVAEPQGDGMADQRPPMTPERRMLIIVCVLLIGVSLAFLLRGLLFNIRHLRVVGIHRITWQEVARSAGLSSSSNYFGLDEKSIREGINANRYLVYERMQRVPPSTLILYVRERQPIASINYIGIAYIMADDGVILERTRELDKHSDLMTVSGLVLRDIRLGSVPLSSRINQVETCIALARELHMQGFANQVQDINLSEISSIYMTTRDGFSVHLGDGRDLRPKIGTIRAVIQRLREGGITGGVIEATVPGEATYRPDSV